MFILREIAWPRGVMSLPFVDTRAIVVDVCWQRTRVGTNLASSEAVALHGWNNEPCVVDGRLKKRWLSGIATSRPLRHLDQRRGFRYNNSEHIDADVFAETTFAVLIQQLVDMLDELVKLAKFARSSWSLVRIVASFPARRLSNALRPGRWMDCLPPPRPLSRCRIFAQTTVKLELGRDVRLWQGRSRWEHMIESLSCIDRGRWVTISRFVEQTRFATRRCYRSDYGIFWRHFKAADMMKTDSCSLLHFLKESFNVCGARSCDSARGKRLAKAWLHSYMGKGKSQILPACVHDLSSYCDRGVSPRNEWFL